MRYHVSALRASFEKGTAYSHGGEGRKTGLTSRRDVDVTVVVHGFIRVYNSFQTSL
jgi:hypothetical protein